MGKVQQRTDWDKFIAAKDRAIGRLSQLHIQKLLEADVELIHGYTKFLDIHSLDVGGRRFTADKILIAVGREAVKPKIPGIEYTITSRQMFELKQQPEHLAIIGSDQIAIKFAGSMNSLISKVTLIVYEDRILPGCDEDIRTTVQEGMIKHGIQIFCNTSVKKIEQLQDGLSLSLAGDCQETLTVDTILCVTGHVSNLSRLSLENAGVEVNQEAITVDKYSRTNQANIFAIGDCTNRPHWTPVASATGRAFADTEFDNKRRIIGYDCIPAVSSKLEAATVGLTEAQAREKFGKSVRCYRQRFQPLFDSIAEPEHPMVGGYAAEIIQCIALAIKTGITKKDFDATIGIHPSVAEEFFTL